MRLLVFLFYIVAFTAVSAPFHVQEDDALLYAKEALTSKDLKASGQLTISSASDTLHLTFKAGFGISSSPKYIRIDLTNGRFNTTFPITGLATDAAYTSTLASGGTLLDSYIIIQVSATTALSPDTEFTLESDSFIWLDSSEPLEVQYTLYDSAAAAVNGGLFINQTLTTLAKVVTAIGSNFTRSFSHSVGFSQGFIRFNPTFRAPSVFSLGDATETLASLGKVQFDNLIVDDVRLASSSVIISDFSDLLPNFNTQAENASLVGDFSTVQAFLNDQGDCDGTSLELAKYSSVDKVSVSINNLIAFPVLCIRAESEILTLKRSAYQLDLGFGLGRSLLGEVIYDAASIDLPYITNYDAYRQRIILVNHAGYDVAYTTRFVSEKNVGDNFLIGDVANGMIAAGTTLKLNAEDLVIIDGNVPSRISARIFIDAKPIDISAAVQILSIGENAPPQTNILQVREF